jgi:hypothetical protein
MPGPWGALPKTTPLRSRARGRASTRLALLLWVSSQSGCFLLGYDGLGKVPGKDASPSDSSGEDSGLDGLLRDGSLGGDTERNDSGTGDGDAALGPDPVPSLDAGADSGANAGDGDNEEAFGWWTGLPVEKCKALAGTACSQTCMAGQGPCIFDCNAIASCGATCSAYTKCRATCSSVGACGHTCAAGADCSYEGKASQTTVSCDYGSTCDVTCPGTVMCNVNCVAGASCLLKCAGVACALNCSGVYLTCPDGTRVCDRPCPG